MESTAAEAAAAAVLAQRGNAGDTLAARSIRASKVTCLVAVYGSCLLKVAGTPRSSPVAPSASYLYGTRCSAQCSALAAARVIQGAIRWFERCMGAHRREAAPSSPKPVYLHAYTHTPRDREYLGTMPRRRRRAQRRGAGRAVRALGSVRRVAHHADARRLRRREDERGEAAGDDGRRDRAERRRLLHAEPEGEEGRGSGRLERLICAKLERAFRAVADDGGREAREQGGCAFLLEHATQAREQ